MARCNVTEDIVADRSGLGVDTVSKMRQGETVKLETVLAFCVALELEEAFRYDLMKKADVRFDMRKKAHKVYLTIFDILPDANVFQINQFLKNENLTTWTKECECKKRRAKKNAAV